MHSPHLKQTKFFFLLGLCVVFQINGNLSNAMEEDEKLEVRLKAHFQEREEMMNKIYGKDIRQVTHEFCQRIKEEEASKTEREREEEQAKRQAHDQAMQEQREKEREKKEMEEEWCAKMMKEREEEKERIAHTLGEKEENKTRDDGECILQ